MEVKRDLKLHITMDEDEARTILGGLEYGLNWITTYIYPDDKKVQAERKDPIYAVMDKIRNGLQTG